MALTELTLITTCTDITLITTLPRYTTWLRPNAHKAVADHTYDLLALSKVSGYIFKLQLSICVTVPIGKTWHSNKLRLTITHATHSEAESAKNSAVLYYAHRKDYILNSKKRGVNLELSACILGGGGGDYLSKNFRRVKKAACNHFRGMQLLQDKLKTSSQNWLIFGVSQALQHSSLCTTHCLKVRDPGVGGT